MPLFKRKKKDQRKEIQEVLEELQRKQGVKIVDIDNMKKIINKQIESKFAMDWFKWMSTPPSEKEWKAKLSDKYIQCAIPLSAVVKSMIEAMCMEYKFDLDINFNRQLSMMIATMLLRDKFPVESKIAYWRVVSSQIASLDPQGSESDTKDKTYI